MSLPKRYSIRGFSAALVEEDNGVMVKYSDYELLRQEFSLLAEERHATICALELEIERLRKAGDELARVAIPSYILDTKVKAIEGWNAAKESRP